MEAVEAESEGKFTYRQIYKYIEDKIPRSTREMQQTHSLEKVPVFQGAGNSSLLYWWHVLCQC